MTSAFPNRLRAARQKAGLTQEQLANELGITKQAVSKYEQGKMLPDSSGLIKLANIMGFRPDYFFREYRISLERVDFRKRASLSGKHLEGVKTEILDKLERYLELEEHLNLSVPFENPVAGLNISHGEDVEEAAQVLLQQWGLGVNPIPNVIEMLEDAYIKVVEAEAEEPKAMAEAFRQGNLGIMDYYRIKNVQADTAMRENIGSDGPESSSSGATGAKK